eukprot:tig00000889_g5293.t1
MSGDRGPIIIGQGDGWDVSSFCVPPHYRDSVSKVLIPNGLIIDRVEKMAQDMIADAGNETVHFLCVLKGGEQFFSDLIHHTKRLRRYSQTSSVPYTLDFIRVSSYVNEQSTGAVKISGAKPEEYAGKNIVIVEDIIDTGLTMSRLVEEVRRHNPKSVRVASLLIKRREGREKAGFQADYVGFSIPDFFVVGYCLDYNEYFRDLDHICLISDTGKEKYRVQT